MKHEFLRVIAQVILLAVLVWMVVAFLASCGRGGNSVGAGSKPALASHDTTSPRAGLEPAPTIPLADVLAQIDAYPAPKNVSAERWGTLTAALKKLIVARSKDGKTISVAPTGVGNSVSDLAAVSNGAGTQATLTWTEALAGDCNNDGAVSIADLQPIAAHYGETSTGPGSAAYLADANGDGQVDITDLQPIANNYSAHLEGYQVWRGHYNGATTDWDAAFRPNVDNPANTAFSADRTNTPPASARPAYTYKDDISGLADKANVRYKVTVYGDGAAGEDSNAAIMPPPTPTTFNVSGTVLESGVGLAGVTMTLAPGGLSATTQADGTYTITGVADGSYTLTPTLSGYTFTPPTKPVNVSGADVSGQDFTAAPTHSVSGTVILGVLGPLGGVTMTLTPGGLNATTAADGTYTITDVADGSYTLTPTLSGYTFTPLTKSVNVAGADVAGQDFAATPAGLAVTPWPKFHANSQNTGLSPYVGAQTNTVKWTATTAGWVGSSPSIGADGTIYVGSADNSVYAINPSDGSIKWWHATGGGIFSSPAIGKDATVYVGSYDNNFYALNPADGTVKWMYATGGLIPSSPAIGADGTIFVGSYDGQVYAFNPVDGSLKWTSSVAGQVNSSPAIGSDGTVYIGSVGNNAMYALNPADGSVKWSYTTGGPVLGSPGIGADGTVYVGSFDNKVYALNSTDGSVKWTYATGGNIDCSPAIASDGTVYIGSRDKNLYALNPADGSLKWSFATGDLVISCPAVGADGTVYVGSFDHNVYALNPADGSVKWSYTTGGQVYSSPAIAADGTVYIGSYDNKVYAFGP